MSEEFVRKDVYDVEIRRIDERIDSAVDRIEAKTDAYMARMEAAFAEMKGEMSAIRAGLNNISRNVTWIVTAFGVIISAVSIFMQFLR